MGMACGCANDIAVLDFAGVDAWVDKIDRLTGEKLEESRPIPELEIVNWADRRVNQCFDSDIVEKPSVRFQISDCNDSLPPPG